MLCDTFLSVNTPVQQAAADILRFGNFVNRRIHDRVRRNYASLRELTGSGSPVTTLEADAGWSAMLRLPAIMSDEEWALAMLEHGVLVRPGHFFDSEDGDADGSGPEVLVAVSLLPREEAFDRGVKLALACVRERC
jgi:DNA-binding transcriptional MocR family regulator